MQPATSDWQVRKLCDMEVRTDFVLKNGFEKSLRFYAGQELRREAIDVTGDIN